MRTTEAEDELKISPAEGCFDESTSTAVEGSKVFVPGFAFNAATSTTSLDGITVGTANCFATSERLSAASGRFESGDRFSKTSTAILKTTTAPQSSLETRLMVPLDIESCGRSSGNEIQKITSKHQVQTQIPRCPHLVDSHAVT